MSLLKALYHGTIKPMVFGYGEGDNYKSRGEMQNLFMQHKIGTLMFDPVEWYKQLGMPIAQIADNEITERIQAADNERIERIMPASNAFSKGITIQELKGYLKEKTEQDNPKIYSFRSKNIPCVPKRTEQIGYDFLTNSPVYMVFPMNEKEFFEAKSNRMPYYQKGNGRKSNGHSLGI